MNLQLPLHTALIQICITQNIIHVLQNVVWLHNNHTPLNVDTLHMRCNEIAL